jgi:phage gp29-like protein
MSALADLCDQLLADERVRKSYETVVGGLLSLPLGFEEGLGRKRKRAEKALNAEEDWWAAFPEAELQQFLTAGRIAGVAFAQLRWEFRKDRLVPKLEPWSLANFRFDWQQRKWFARVDDGSAEVEVTPGDGRWVMYAPYGTTRPWSLGQWRGLAPWWLLKRYAVSDWGRTGAVGASFVATPIPDQINEESIKDQRRQLSDHIYELSQQGGVIVLPNGFKLEVVETTANTSRIYKEQIATANTSIDIAVQGQNLTSQVEGGSFAATSVHSQVQDRVIANVASSASTTLHDQALTKWAEFNFGSAELAPWPVWDTDPPEDTLSEAESQKAFGEALSAVQDAGFEVDNVDELAAKHGLKLKKRDEPKADPAPVPNTGGKSALPAPPNKKSAKAQAARANGGFVAALASGAPISENPGFVEGQLYADAVAESGTEAAEAALEPTFEAIAKVIDESTSYEDMRERLNALMPELDAAALSELCYRVMLLGEFAGRRAVNQDG